MTWNSLDEALTALRHKNQAHWNGYLGFYSSWLGGYFKEAWAMSVPMDDHGFHRGDGVFEAARIHNRAFIDLRAHLERLERSAAAIQMKLPKTIDEIGQICVNLAKLCDSPTGTLRLYVTRGPGGFSPNPAEVVGHQIYAAITQFKAPSDEAYAKGVRAMTSTIPAKEPRWAQIKSCNYLQNVLMKKETVDKGYDFALSVTPSGYVCEGATENLLLVTQGDEVVVPKFDYTLRGTTVSVAMKLAEGLKGIKSVRLGDVTREDVLKAKEAAFVGTTLGVLPVASLDGQPIGSGSAGEITKALHARLMQHMAEDPAIRTPF